MYGLLFKNILCAFNSVFSYSQSQDCGTSKVNHMLGRRHPNLPLGVNGWHLVVDHYQVICKHKARFCHTKSSMVLPYLLPELCEGKLLLCLLFGNESLDHSCSFWSDGSGSQEPQWQCYPLKKTVISSVVLHIPCSCVSRSFYNIGVNCTCFYWYIEHIYVHVCIHLYIICNVLRHWAAVFSFLVALRDLTVMILRNLIQVIAGFVHFLFSEQDGLSLGKDCAEKNESLFYSKT